jgi:hypothetical protein
MLTHCAVFVEVDQQLLQMMNKSIGMLQNTTNVVTTQMTLDMKSPVKKVLPVKTTKMEKAIMSLFASLIQQILVRVQMAHGEEAQLSLTDIGSLMMTALLDIGSVKMAK